LTPLGDASSPWLAYSKAYVGTCGGACAAGQNFECLGHIAPPDPQVDRCRVNLHLADAVSSAIPAPAIQVAICTPSGCGLPVTQTDANGYAAFDIPLVAFVPGPPGFLELSSAPDAGSLPIVPTHVYWGSPLAGPTLNVPQLPVDTQSELELVGRSAGVTLDSSRGAIAIVALDCSGGLAPGIQFEVDAAGQGAQVFYWANHSPSRSATMTDGQGFGGAANVPVGPATVKATSVALKRAVSRLSITVQAGTLTWVLMPPLL
jgi:hypothetical protein